MVLELDAAKDPKRARRLRAGRLVRKKWMTEHGCRHLLRGVRRTVASAARLVGQIYRPSGVLLLRRAPCAESR